jgi:hypothetical protein
MTNSKIIEFPEELTVDQQLEFLFKFHNFDRYVKIDEEDKPMIVMALNQIDVESVECDEEGGLVIQYSGDEDEQRTI